MKKNRDNYFFEKNLKCKVKFCIQYLIAVIFFLLSSKICNADNLPNTNDTRGSSNGIEIKANSFNYRDYTESALKINISSDPNIESAVNQYFGNAKYMSPEQQKLDQYTGIPGTAPRGDTITAAGSAIEQVPSGADIFVFFTQTLSNGFYYEGRLYGKYNMLTQDPVTPSIPPSSENNPMGYKGVVKLGYNFHVTQVLDITPYLRLEAGHNYGSVYSDTEGNTINSQNYAFLPGFKQTFNLTHDFVPYIDIYGGYQLIDMTGNFKQGPTANQNVYGSVNQMAITTELGFGYVVSEHLTVIPYTQFAYISNSPNEVAASPYNKGGFNISQLTGYQPMAAIKLSYAW